MQDHITPRTHPHIAQKRASTPGRRGVIRALKRLLPSSESESNRTREEREGGKSKTHFHPSPRHVEPVLGVFSFHLTVMRLRGFCGVPSALSSQEACADLIINRDTRSLRTTTPSQLRAKAPRPSLARACRRVTASLSGPASLLCWPWMPD